MQEDTRNVIDHYKYWTNEAIKADLDEKRHPFSVLISNKFYDFNIGSVVRSANAFLASNVFIYGRSKWDRRGAVGTYIYENIKKVKCVEDVNEALTSLNGNIHVVGIDNVDEAVPIESFNWPGPDTHTVLVFGQEDVGIPEELLALCNDVVYIQQYGSVRSLNVGCAASIAMFSYVTQVHQRANGPTL